MRIPQDNTSRQFKQHVRGYDDTTRWDMIRMEQYRELEIAEVDNVRYIDDSFSCSPKATWYALSNVNGPVILIAGGRDDRGSSVYSIMDEEVKNKVKIIVVLEGGYFLRSRYTGNDGPYIIDTRDIFEAVTRASAMAEKGFTILYSPGCPPLDEFGTIYDRKIKYLAAIKQVLLDKVV